MAAQKPNNDEVERLIEQLGSLDLNHFLNAVSEASRRQSKRLDRFIADAVAKDIQSHLVALGYEPECPECHSKHTQRDGKRGSIQRYRCADCGHRFTAFSGSIMEKTYYTWDAWVAVIHGMLNGQSIEKTRQILQDDYMCVDIHTSTVWRMRLKVMYAISTLPSPVLVGTIQFDDTFLREDQKASRALTNPLPRDIKETREPRYGRVPSQIGVMGTEFATITTGIDESGHCVCRVLSMGSVSPEVLYDFMEEHTMGISYACSDADGTYGDVFAAMRVPHYVRPSKYLDIIRKAGYEQPSRADKTVAEGQVAYNSKLLERLWSEGAIDYIANRGNMTYTEFCQLKKEHKLGMGRVNELHKDLKAMLEKNTAGVSTKYLPYYVAWFEFLKNRRVDTGRSVASRAEAERILVEVINTRVNLTSADIDRIRKAPLDLPKASGRYLHLLEKRTAEVRRKSGNLGFYFGDEDGVATFNRRDVLSNMTNAQLRELAKRLHIKGAYKLARSYLIAELMRHKDLPEHLFMVAAGDASERRDTVASGGKYYKRYDYNHNRPVLPKATFPPRVFTTPEYAEAPVAFFDVETTGLRLTYDEVLSLTIISLDGEVLYEQMFKPEHHKRWSKAEQINHISPADVADKPTLASEKERIEAVIASVGCLVGWNSRFDMNMLFANGIDLPVANGRYCDLMPSYCRARGLADRSYRARKKDKLVNATAYLGIDHDAHTASGDAAVLIPIWNWVLGELGTTEAAPAPNAS